MNNKYKNGTTFSSNKHNKYVEFQHLNFTIQTSTNQIFKISKFNISQFHNSKLHLFKLHGPASILNYQKNVKLRQNWFHIKDMGNPLPESCAMLFMTLCPGWILKQHTRNMIFAHQSQKTESYTAWRPSWSTNKT